MLYKTDIITVNKLNKEVKFMSDINLNEYVLTEDEVSKMLVGSLREASEINTEPENLYANVVRIFKFKTMTYIIGNLKKIKDLNNSASLSFQDLDLVTNSDDAEVSGIRNVINAIENYILGVNTDLDKFLLSPLDKKLEVTKLSIWMNICVKIHDIMLSEEYKQKSKEGRFEIIKDVYIRTLDDVSYIKNQLRALREKAADDAQTVAKIDALLYDIDKKTSINEVDKIVEELRES